MASHNPYNRQPLPRICNQIEFEDWSAYHYMSSSHQVAERDIDGYQRAVALARIPVTAQVLDIACRMGVVGKVIAETRSKNFDNIFFADAADDMLGHVQRDLTSITGGANAYDHHIARCDFRDPAAMETITKQFSRSADFQSAGGFDCVFAINILHHITDKSLARAVNQLFSFVKPGGFLVVDFLARPKATKIGLLGPVMVRSIHLTKGDIFAPIRPTAAAHCVGPEQLRYLSSSFAELVERIGAGDLVRKEERHDRSDDIGVKWINYHPQFQISYRGSRLPTEEARFDAAHGAIMNAVYSMLSLTNEGKFTNVLSFGYNAVFKKA